MVYWNFQELLLGVLVALAFSWGWFQWKNRKLLHLARTLPTIKPTLPLFGHILMSAVRHKWDARAIFKETCVDIPLEAAIKGLQHFVLWIGPTPIITTLNPDDIKTILTSSKTMKKTFVAEYVKFAIGDGLLTAPTALWRPSRKHIQPLFQSRNLEHVLPAFNRHSKILVKQLSNIDNDRCYDVLHPVYSLTTLNTLDLVLGPTLQDANIDTKQVLNFVLRSFHLWTTRVLYFWLHYDMLFKLIYWNPLCYLKKEASFLIGPATKELQKRMKLRSTTENADCFGEINRITMADVFTPLILSNPNFTEKNFHDNVCTIVAGGIDTTTMTLSTCMLLLAMHPEVQEKVYEEVAAAFRGTDEDLYLDDLKSFAYMEQVLKETMRLFPIFPAVSRIATQDIKLSFGVVPADSILVVSIIGVHKNPKFYPEPFKFNPEHFSAENSSRRPPFAYIPFSGGPRNCIGKNYSMMSMKTALAHVLREYHLSTDIEFNDIELTMNIQLTIKNGFHVRFHKRETRL